MRVNADITLAKRSVISNPSRSKLMERTNSKGSGLGMFFLKLCQQLSVFFPRKISHAV